MLSNKKIKTVLLLLKKITSKVYKNKQEAKGNDLRFCVSISYFHLRFKLQVIFSDFCCCLELKLGLQVSLD